MMPEGAIFPTTEAAQEPEVFYRRILDSLSDGVYFVDTTQRITYWNRGAEAIAGYPAAEVIGRLCRDNLLVHTDIDGCGLCTNGCPLLATLADGKPRQSDVFLKHRAGHRIPISVRASPIYDGNGTVIGGVEVFSENTTKMAAIEKALAMEQLALIDPLTGAGNRRYAESILREQEELFRRENDQFAILFVDLDHFKAINDDFGHDTGDSVLQTVARTLGSNLRSFDFLGRWGGEEFLIVLPKADVGRAQTVAKRCCGLVRSCAIESAGRVIRPTISIGFRAIRPGETAAHAVRCADEHLYQAKNAGRDCIRGS